MSILSRFRRQKKHEAPEELDKTLANSEEEGLFISTGADQASSGEDAQPGAAASVAEDTTDQEEIDDLLEAAENDPAPSTIGMAVAESSDEAVAEDETGASQAEIDKMLAAQDEPAAAESSDEAVAADEAGANQADDDLLEAAQDEPAVAEVADAAPEEEKVAASESDVDDLLEAAQDGEAAAEQQQEEEADPLAAGSAEESDDPLAAFGDAVVESEDADLLKTLEDVPVEELLTEARELRALLPEIDESQEAA